MARVRPFGDARTRTNGPGGATASRETVPAASARAITSSPPALLTGPGHVSQRSIAGGHELGRPCQRIERAAPHAFDHWYRLARDLGRPPIEARGVNHSRQCVDEVPARQIPRVAPTVDHGPVLARFQSVPPSPGVDTCPSTQPKATGLGTGPAKASGSGAMRWPRSWPYPTGEAICRVRGCEQHRPAIRQHLGPVRLLTGLDGDDSLCGRVASLAAQHAARPLPYEDAWLAPRDPEWRAGCADAVQRCHQRRLLGAGQPRRDRSKTQPICRPVRRRES